jgi:hypothetical protein
MKKTRAENHATPPDKQENNITKRRVASIILLPQGNYD